MFVPGVNGSVIPSAPSSSRLKGAYKSSKNSKKRKMPNGGLSYTPYSSVQNRYTDSPVQKAVIKPRVGDTISPNYTKLYTDLGVDIGSLTPGYIGKAFNAVSMLRAADNNDYNQGLELMPGKKANLISITNDINNIATAKPYKYQGRKMPNGGVVFGDYDKSSAPKKGNYLLPDINRPSYLDSSGDKRSEYKMGVNIDGKETLIPTVVNGKQLTEDQAIDRYNQTGLHMGKFNNVKDANYASRLRTARYNMLEDPIRFQANQFKKGGEVEDDNDDKEMVDGVASILRGVKSKSNRLQLANKLAKQFNREEVNYNLPSFLKKSNIKK